MSLKGRRMVSSLGSAYSLWGVSGFQGSALRIKLVPTPIHVDRETDLLRQWMLTDPQQFWNPRAHSQQLHSVGQALRNIHLGGMPTWPEWDNFDGIQLQPDSHLFTDLSLVSKSQQPWDDAGLFRIRRRDLWTERHECPKRLNWASWTNRKVSPLCANLELPETPLLV